MARVERTGSGGLGRAPEMEELLRAAYSTLRELAHAKMSGEPAGHTLDATALVHEAYLRLLHEGRTSWNDSTHFYRAAAEAMRRILVERARRVRRLRHGGNLLRVPLDQEQFPGAHDPERTLALDRALTELESQSPRRADVVKLRYFVGLSIAETARQLGVSPATVKLEWAYARAWLRKRIGENGV